MFRLKALGGLLLESDSDALPASASQRRRLTLLVVLASAGELGVSRDKLLALLWPENTEESARHALDQLLYATRRDLGKQVIASEGGQLRLNSEVVWSDVAEFDTHVQAGEWGAAIHLYGGPFLDGVHLGDSAELERWADAERTRLEARFLEALEQLATHAAKQGNAQAAVGWWRRRVAAEPLSGSAALGLMRALAAAGDRVGSLQYARTYAALLREELDTEPDPEFLALAESVQCEQVAEPRQVSTVPRQALANRDVPQEPKPIPTHSRVSNTRRAAIIGAMILIVGLGGAIVVGNAHTPEEASQGPAPSRVVPPAPPAVSTRAADPEARALYLRGRIAWNRRSREGLQEAVVLFRKATERDPTYADAYAGLADAYVILGYLGYMPGAAAFPKGKAAALRALALDPQRGEAYAALGVALQWDREWQEAEQAFLRAIRYSPEHATAHQWYALLLRVLGRADDAIAHAERAAKLDPLSIQVQNTYAITLSARGMRDSALHVYERVVTDEPDTAWVRQNPWVLSNFGGIAGAAGRHAEAVRLIERAALAVPGHPRPLYTLATVYLAAGDSAQARAAFARADPTHPHYPLYRALLHAHFGEMDAAFGLLDRVEEWSPVLVMTFAGAKKLQADPRYAVLRRKLRLPDLPRSR